MLNIAHSKFNNYWLHLSDCIYFITCYFFGITSSAVGTNIFAITAGIKKYKSTIKKKKKKHDKIVFLGKDKSLIDSYISHDKFVSVYNVLREYYKIKKGIKIPESFVEYNI